MYEFVKQIIPQLKNQNVLDTNGHTNFFSCKLEEIDVNSDFMQSPHICDFFSIYYLTDGSIAKTNQIKSLNIQKNEIFFSKPGELKTLNKVLKPEGYLIVFTQDFLLTLVDNKNLINTFDYLISNAKRKFTLSAIYVTFFNTVFKEINEEFNNPEKHGKELVKFWIFVLLIKTNRMYAQDAAIDEHILLESTPDYIYHKFLVLLDTSFNKLINGEIHKPEKVKDFAAALCMSPSYFGECIKKISGKSAKTLIDERIILMAKCQLLHTSKTISEIAFSLGFESSSYFIRFFKKYQRITPLEFKKTSLQLA